MAFSGVGGGWVNIGLNNMATIKIQPLPNVRHPEGRMRAPRFHQRASSPEGPFVNTIFYVAKGKC
jgi:hypothetical protein